MAKKAKAKKKAAKGREMLVVGSKVKQAIKDHGLMMSGELLEGLNECVHACLEKAVWRANENKRKTVQKRDL